MFRFPGSIVVLALLAGSLTGARRRPMPLRARGSFPLLIKIGVFSGPMPPAPKIPISTIPPLAYSKRASRLEHRRAV